jgi:glycosyltransferase involved in cell wall biosynthesis
MKMLSHEEFYGTEAVAVVVTCHKAYFKFLNAQVEHVDSQSIRPAQRIIAYDGVDWQHACRKLRRLYPGWMVIGGEWGSPNPARNAALKLVSGEWVVFADADDFMHRDYIKGVCDVAENASHDVGIIYADLHFTTGKQVCFQTYDYWRLRLQNCISAAAAWRVSAIREVGGWEMTDCYDDWSLALKITRRRWKCVKQAFPIKVRYHSNHRRDDAAVKEYKHKLTRSYGIVTLLAGRFDCLDKWLDWLADEPFPAETALYCLDNSCNPEFTEQTRAAVQSIARRRGLPVFYKIDNRKCYPDSHPLARHEHVPSLYNSILPHVAEDMVLTIEDDVVPPRGAFVDIIRSFVVGQKTGAVSGVYPSRSMEGKIVGAFGDMAGNKEERDYWRNLLTYDDVQGSELVPVKFIGGGFALWHNALVKRFLPFRFLNWHGKASGWDSQISRSIRKAGYSLYINPNIRCEHNFR